MPAITPSFVASFESRMRVFTLNEYERMAQNLWYDKITKRMTSDKKEEIIAWILSTAQIYDQGKGGNIKFTDLVAKSTKYVNGNAGTALRLKRDQLEDNDGDGLPLATKWSSDIGAYMAYWPQKQVAKLINNGETGKAYDGKAFFAADHPVNPVTPNGVNYCNLYTGSASGIQPGALPIDATNASTVDTALTNLGKAIAAVKKIPMPNGVDPRYLNVKYLLVPPALTVRAQQLTKAKYIAQAAGSSGGGAADIEAVINNWGFAEPIEVREFGADFGGSDTSYYLGCEEMSSDQLGALLYIDREPFKITYYTGQGGGTGADAVLDRARRLEWHCQGRNVSAYGHPFYLIKVKAA